MGKIHKSDEEIFKDNFGNPLKIGDKVVNSPRSKYGLPGVYEIIGRTPFYLKGKFISYINDYRHIHTTDNKQALQGYIFKYF